MPFGPVGVDLCLTVLGQKAILSRGQKRVMSLLDLIRIYGMGLNVAIVYVHSNGICAPIKWLQCAAILLVDTHTMCTFHNMKIICILQQLIC